MKKKNIVIGVLCLILLACFPFQMRINDTNNIRQDQSVTCLKALVWQYDYYCENMHNDGSYTMKKTFTFFFCIPIYENTEKMMFDLEGNLVSWESPTVIDQI